MLEWKNVETNDMLNELARRIKGGLKKASTSDLVDELATRRGVRVSVVDPYEKGYLSVDGPAIILTVRD